LDARKSKAEVCLGGERRLHTVAGMPIPYAQPERYPAIATHPATEAPLLEIMTTIFAVSVSWTGCPRRVRLVLPGAIEGNGGCILMQPRGRDGIDLQRFERDRSKNPVEIGGKQGIEDVA